MVFKRNRLFDDLKSTFGSLMKKTKEKLKLLFLEVRSGFFGSDMRMMIVAGNMVWNDVWNHNTDMHIDRDDL